MKIFNLKNNLIIQSIKNKRLLVLSKKYKKIYFFKNIRLETIELKKKYEDKKIEIIDMLFNLKKRNLLKKFNKTIFEEIIEYDGIKEYANIRKINKDNSDLKAFINEIEETIKTSAIIFRIKIEEQKEINLKEFEYDKKLLIKEFLNKHYESIRRTVIKPLELIELKYYNSELDELYANVLKTEKILGLDIILELIIVLDRNIEKQIQTKDLKLLLENKIESITV